MPFDNPHQTPFGDLELLMEARGRISSRDTWVQGHFQKRWALLSCGLAVVDVRQPQLRHAKPNGTAAISAGCHAYAVQRAIFDSTQVHAVQTAPHSVQ